MDAWLANWFGWYQGGIWTNLAASLLWSGLVWFPTVAHLHRKVDRQHRELLDQNATHRAALKRHLGITEATAGQGGPGT